MLVAGSVVHCLYYLHRFFHILNCHFTRTFSLRHALVLSAPDLSIFTTKLYILTITLNNIEMRNLLFVFN
jgi:hypothetical protein